MYVLFFDIDGTLINTRGSGLTALKLAFAEVFAQPVSAEIATAGRTDRGIARDFFLAHEIEDTGENWLQFSTAYQRHLAIQLPLRDGCVLPGVLGLLEQLAARPDVAVGLLTGNTATGARLKLEHFRLDHHFHFGGYGEQHAEREGVARDALAAAEKYVGRPLSLERVWVIGDTPLDVRCARHIGAQAAAVATGWHARDELVQASPDLLLPDLGRAEALLARVLDSGVSASETSLLREKALSNVQLIRHLVACLQGLSASTGPTYDASGGRPLNTMRRSWGSL